MLAYSLPFKGRLQFSIHCPALLKAGYRDPEEYMVGIHGIADEGGLREVVEG